MLPGDQQSRLALAPLLVVEAAHTAVRKDEDLKRFYQRLAERRGRPKAKVAAARKLLIRTYIMLRDEIDYAEFRHRSRRSSACPPKSQA